MQRLRRFGSAAPFAPGIIRQLNCRIIALLKTGRRGPIRRYHQQAGGRVQGVLRVGQALAGPKASRAV